MIAEAVEGTGWVQEDARRIARSVDGLPCKVLRDSELDALVATVRMGEPWAFVFSGQSTPFGADLAPEEGLPLGYRFDGPLAFTRALAAGPQVRPLLDALREDRVAVEMHNGAVVLRQQRVEAEDAPLVGDAALALATALRDAWDRLVENPLEARGLRWDGEAWVGRTELGDVRVEPGRRLAIRVRFPTGLASGTQLRRRRAGEPPAPLAGGIGHLLTLTGPDLPETFDDERVGEALLALLDSPSSRLDDSGLEAHFRPWPVGRALAERLEDVAAVHWALVSA